VDLITYYRNTTNNSKKHNKFDQFLMRSLKRLYIRNNYEVFMRENVPYNLSRNKVRVNCMEHLFLINYRFILQSIFEQYIFYHTKF